MTNVKTSFPSWKIEISISPEFPAPFMPWSPLTHLLSSLRTFPFSEVGAAFHQPCGLEDEMPSINNHDTNFFLKI